jgi:hypothetical protein
MTDNFTRKAYRDPAKTGTQQHRGRFQPGQSGNPKGRPVGSRHKATLAALALLEGDLEVITTKLIEKAKAGEQWAITLVMNKLIPNAKDQPVTFRLPRMDGAHDLRQAMACILKAMSKGELTPDEGQAIAQVMSVMGLAMMVEDLEKKVERLRGKR